jgi:ribonucleoside-diphosphate reductase alpha chain
LIGDSIEGWADAVKVLMKAYLSGKMLPEFDFGSIRAKGTPLKTSGGKAPGPEPLKDCLHNIKKVLDRKENGESLTPLEVHDINCFIADAVRAGGIRRSAMIALFDLEDEEMLTCKFGDWYVSNPQRGRANNSAVILRHKVKKMDFLALWKKIELSGSGEPGFFFTNDKDWGLNPCGEISLRPFQFCNLVTIHAGTTTTQEELNDRARACAFIATLQASFTNFHYLRPIWKKTTEKEALIGVSMTGIASGQVMGLNMKEAALVVKEENARVAELIGIKPAARCTTVKPEGTSSLVLGTSSGIHSWHDRYYIRRVSVAKSEAIYTYLTINHPEILEDNVFKPKTDAFICIPMKAPEGAITRDETALELLTRVEKVWAEWVKPGHRRGNNMNNVSTTVTVKPHEWGEVGEWMWQNRENYTALAILPHDGGTHVQTPFESITKERYEELSAKLHKINLDDVIEVGDDTSRQGEVACGGGACEVT